MYRIDSIYFVTVNNSAQRNEEQRRWWQQQQLQQQMCIRTAARYILDNNSISFFIFIFQATANVNTFYMHIFLVFAAVCFVSPLAHSHSLFRSCCQVCHPFMMTATAAAAAAASNCV